MLNAALLTLAAAASLADLGPVPQTSVRVFLVRHGQAFSNLDPEPDLPPEKLDRLTDLGRTQAVSVGSALRGRGVRLVLTSPAGRARETADQVHKAIEGATLRVEPALRPLELGRSSNGAALDWDQRIADWEAGRDPSPAGGESMEQLGRRVADLVATLAKQHAGASVVLVAHSEVIGSFLGHVRGTPPAKRYPPDIANGSISVVEVPRDGPPALVFANQKPAEAVAR
jgi:broad specificity phosphatase PhoE